jgi:hypothetical protein
MTSRSCSIWIMDGDGSNARMLVGIQKGDGELAWPHVSPDGTMVAYDHSGAAAIVDIGTGVVTELGPGGEPAWYDDHS